jgi:hypothetical protein
MTPEAQRIAIAEACGWMEIKEYQHLLWGFHPKEGFQEAPVPDYLNDLNAIQSAVLSQGAEFQRKFDAELRRCVYTGHLHNMTAETWAACFIACLTSTATKGN